MTYNCVDSLLLLYDMFRGLTRRLGAEAGLLFTRSVDAAVQSLQACRPAGKPAALAAAIMVANYAWPEVPPGALQRALIDVIREKGLASARTMATLENRIQRCTARLLAAMRPNRPPSDAVALVYVRWAARRLQLANPAEERAEALAAEAAKNGISPSTAAAVALIVAAGVPVKTAAETLGVSRTSIYTALQKLRLQNA